MADLVNSPWLYTSPSDEPLELSKTLQSFLWRVYSGAASSMILSTSFFILQSTAEDCSEVVLECRGSF